MGRFRTDSNVPDTTLFADVFPGKGEFRGECEKDSAG
jgi:hypothetical protein